MGATLLVFSIPAHNLSEPIGTSEAPSNTRRMLRTSVASPTSVPVALRYGSSSGLAIQFEYRIVPPPPKPVRNVLQGKNRLINYEPKSGGK